MANPQPDRYTKLSNELYEAIMQTDFSKRQRNILDMIMRFSYGCGKKTALLRNSDFEQCGVGRNKIKAELEYLEQAKVIIRDGELVQLNKNYEQWRVNLIKTFNQQKFNEILKRNLSVPKTGTPIPETGTEEKVSSQNGNSPVPKTGTDTASNPSNDNGFEPRKEIVNKSTTTIITTTDDHPENDNLTEQEKAAGEVAEYWRDKQNVIYVSNADLNIINDLVVEKNIPKETIIEVIEDLYTRFEEQNKDKPWKKIKSIKYFVDRIFEVHHEKTNPKPINNVTPFRKQRQEREWSYATGGQKVSKHPGSSGSHPRKPSLDERIIAEQERRLAELEAKWGGA